MDKKILDAVRKLEIIGKRAGFTTAQIKLLFDAAMTFQ